MEIEIVKWIQQFSSPFLDIFFQGITVFGEESLYLVVLTILYWTISKEAGQYVGFALFASFAVNNGLKDAFQIPRPVGIEGIRSLRLHTATGYAFPSGHAQGAAAFLTALASVIRKRWITILFAIIIFLVGVSRMYLGVHYPKDVIVGIALGVGIALLAYRFRHAHNLVQWQFTLAIIFTIGLVFFHSQDYVKAYGIFTGYIVGLLFEKKYVSFTVNVAVWKRMFRWIIGIILLLIIKSGGKVLFPEHLFFDGLRYFLIGFVAIGFYPLLFKFWRL